MTKIYFPVAMDGTKKRESCIFTPAPPYPPIQCWLSSMAFGVSIEILIFLPAASGFNIESGGRGRNERPKITNSRFLLPSMAAHKTCWVTIRNPIFTHRPAHVPKPSHAHPCTHAGQNNNRWSDERAHMEGRVRAGVHGQAVGARSPSHRQRPPPQDYVQTAIG
jgi:hypothetical protein